jgi:hypothetical protein
MVKKQTKKKLRVRNPPPEHFMQRDALVQVRLSTFMIASARNTWPLKKGEYPSHSQMKKKLK